VRGVLVVNPHATTTSPLTTDVIVQAASHELDLEVTFTTHRGHAVKIAQDARNRHLDVVLTLGGDGLVNEVINGLLEPDAEGPVPSIAPIPGGSANVFARALGIPTDPVEATGLILQAARGSRGRMIGLGLAAVDRATGVEDRWFAANAGIGIDAQIIESVDQQRMRGRSATPMRYLTTTVREVLTRIDRTNPALTVVRSGMAPVRDVFMCLVQNTAPWTYFGPWPIDPNPLASFDTGLDLFAMKSLGPWATARAARRMVMRTPGLLPSNGLLSWHDVAEFGVEASREVPMQVDGESVGTVRGARFLACPDAIRVLC
jgi:diacylglycerol kinase family enzyme